MQNLVFRPGRCGDLDHIEPIGRGHLPQGPQIGAAGAQENGFLATIDRIITGHARLRRAGLDLDENQHLAIAADQIDFLASIRRVSPVAGDHAIALGTQKAGGQTLPLLPTGRNRPGR